MKRWVAMAALLLAGCPTARIPRIPGDPPPRVSDAHAEDAYQSMLERHTQSRGVYDHLDTKVFFQATWQSDAFVHARVRREGLFKAWPAEELEQHLASERSRLEGATEFFMAVHANDYRFDDFDRPQSMWRVALKVGGQDLAPTSIVRLGRTNTELRSYYSYLESFWVGYRVRFPKVVAAPGEAMTLKLASALGQAELPFTAD